MIFKELVENKKIAVVGNALSLQYQRRGAEIDAHDIVIRINVPGNLYYQDKKEIYGTKMDIWCLWKANIFLQKNNDIEKEKIESYFFDRQDIYKIEVLESDVKVNSVETLYNIDTLQVLENRIIKLYYFRFKRKFYKFSTGFLLLNYLSECNAKSVSIYGFDFKQTPTFYDKNLNKYISGGFDTRCGHDYRIEQKYITQHFLKTHRNFKLII